MNMLNNASDYISGNINKDKAKDLAAASAEVTIEDNWKGDIKAGAFAGLENPVSINTNDITGIEDGAFKDCKRLETLIMPNIERVGENVFEGCSSLHKVDVKDENMARIVIEKIKACNLIQRIDIYIAGEFKISIKNNCEYLFSDKVRELMKDYDTLLVPHYDFTGMEENVIPAEAFKSVPWLHSLDISAATIIEDDAFKNCGVWLHRINVKDEDMAGIVIKKLAQNKEFDIYIDGRYKITIQNNQEYLSWNMIPNLIRGDTLLVPHYEFTELTENIIPEGGINGLKEGITKIDANATTIVENRAFRCSKVKEIFLSNVREIGNEAFRGCRSLRNVHVNDSMVSRVKAVLKESGLSQQVYIYSNGAIVGYLHNKLSKAIIEEEKTRDEHWIIDDNMEIPECYTEIDNSTFKGLNITSINTNKVTTIGYDVLTHCDNLKELYLPNVEKISWDFCRSCPKIEKVTVKDEPMAHVIKERFSEDYKLVDADINIYVEGKDEPFIEMKKGPSIHGNKFISIIKKMYSNLDIDQRCINVGLNIAMSEYTDPDNVPFNALTLVAREIAQMSHQTLTDSEIKSMIDKAISEIDN